MPFREKIAWITAGSLLIVFGGYFWTLAQSWDATRGFVSIPLMIGAVVLLTIFMAGYSIAAAIGSPREANAPADEREKLIDLKAERIASYVVSICVLCLIGALLIGWNGLLVANLLLASMVISELTKAVAQIVSYRTGA